MKRGKLFTCYAAAALGVAALAIWAIARSFKSGDPPQNDMPVDQRVRATTIESAIERLNQHYVFPEIAATVARDLRSRLERGEFDTVTSAETFAQRLTDTLRRETHDAHIEVRYIEKPIPEQAPDQPESSGQQAAEQLQQLRLNYGFSGFTRLRGNIGLVDVRFFGRPPHAARRVAALMALLADTGALIVDLRRCGGGDPETVMHFASYLYDRPTHLNDIYWRDENRTEERWTAEAVSGQRFGESRKLYLLTSRDTFSGCEDLAYALKNNGRATLVGETTGGGAHAGSPHRLGPHFMMFVPSGRPINPITKTDWEGVGVTPDVAVDAKRALDVAHIAALKAMAAVERDARWKQQLLAQVKEME